MPASPENTPGNAASPVRDVRLVGRDTGLLKNLPAFDKKRHTLPAAATPAARAFLARLIAAPLAEEAETFFQNTRAALGYKRKDLTLSVAPPNATLAARDFTLDLAYDLDPADPSAFVLTRTLHGIRNGDLLLLEPFDALFAARFDALLLTLKKNVRVEAVIDAVEALPPETLSVAYPSDCAHCVLSVPGVAAELLCDGASLEMRFPAPASPARLVAGFEKARHAFRLSKAPALAALAT